jgi:hypothetical protein
MPGIVDDPSGVLEKRSLAGPADGAQLRGSSVRTLDR